MEGICAWPSFEALPCPESEGLLAIICLREHQSRRAELAGTVEKQPLEAIHNARAVALATNARPLRNRLDEYIQDNSVGIDVMEQLEV